MFEKVKKSVLYYRAPLSCLQTKENPNFQIFRSTSEQLMKVFQLSLNSLNAYNQK